MKKTNFQLLSTLILAALIVGIYWFTRLTNLTIFPIFTDEAIYLRWSQIGSFDPNWRFIPLVDGKPPLYHWLVMITLRLFADPLIAGRIVSVVTGFISLIGIALLAHLLFKKKSLTILAAILYLTSPFMLMYDRLAVVDALLTTISIYSLILATWLARSNRLDSALLFGAAVGAGMLTKSSGLLFLLLSPATILLKKLSRKTALRNLLSWTLLLGVALIVSQLIYGILRLSSLYYRIDQKNAEFLIPFAQFLSEPFSLTYGNAKSLIVWQLGYLTLPLVLVIIGSFFSRQFYRQKLILLWYFLVPFLMIASFNKIIFPRFLLFSTPFLLLLAAVGITQLIKPLKYLWLKCLVIILLLLPPTVTSFHLVTNPALAKIPQADRDQHWDSWPAGHGIAEIVAYLKVQAQSEPIFVGTQGTFGLMPYALEIYLFNNPNVQIQSYWPVSSVPDEVQAQAQIQKTFFIYNELEDIPPQPNLKLIMEFQKIRLDEIRHLRLFEVLPSNP